MLYLNALPCAHDKARSLQVFVSLLVYATRNKL